MLEGRFSLAYNAASHTRASTQSTGWVRSSMAGRFKGNSSNIWSLAAFLAASIIVFVASRGTEFQQFGIGLVTASVALFLIMGIFGAISQIVTSWFDSLDEENSHSQSAE